MKAMTPSLGHPWDLGEALSAYGADCAGKEGLAALPDYRTRRWGPPSPTLIQNWLHPTKRLPRGRPLLGRAARRPQGTGGRPRAPRDAQVSPETARQGLVPPPYPLGMTPKRNCNSCSGKRGQRGQNGNK